LIDGQPVRNRVLRSLKIYYLVGILKGLLRFGPALAVTLDATLDLDIEGARARGLESIHRYPGSPTVLSRLGDYLFLFFAGHNG
jgi:hypothetical protein